jgi:hypothetical protein
MVLARVEREEVDAGGAHRGLEEADEEPIELGLRGGLLDDVGKAAQHLGVFAFGAEHRLALGHPAVEADEGVLKGRHLADGALAGGGVEPGARLDLGREGPQGHGDAPVAPSQ